MRLIGTIQNEREQRFRLNWIGETFFNLIYKVDVFIYM
jgi:hypothetical protein